MNGNVELTSFGGSLQFTDRGQVRTLVGNPQVTTSSFQNNGQSFHIILSVENNGINIRDSIDIDVATGRIYDDDATGTLDHQGQIRYPFPNSQITYQNSMHRPG